MNAHSARARRHGRVTEFDAAAGDGTDIDYVLAPGHLGRWEARDIRPA